MDGIMKIGVIGLAAAGGGGRVGIGEDDIGDGMQCSDHPYRNNPGGICAFCLQEKLGKLVSSSFPLPIRGSSSPSFRSDVAGASVGVGSGGSGGVSGVTSLPSIALHPTKVGTGTGSYEEQYTKRARIPFLLAKKKKKIAMESTTISSDRNTVFMRSKSTAAPARRSHFLDNDGEDLISPRRRGGFWSFLYLSSSSSSSSSSSKLSSTTTTKKKIS